MRKLLALLLALLQGCWTNSAVRMGRLTPPPPREAPIFVRFSNPADAPIPDPSWRIRDALRHKGYRLAEQAEGAIVLDITVKNAHWTPVGERVVSGGAHIDPFPRGPARGQGRGGKMSDAEVALLAIFFVVLIGVAIAAASQPTEWLTGRVDVSLHRDGEPPQQAAIDLRFSCASDRTGTLFAVRDHIADRVLEMF